VTSEATTLEEWRAEAERLHRRYLVEVVEAHGFCPWAQRARLGGTTAIRVLLHTSSEASSAGSVDALEGWAPDEKVEVGFLLYPRVSLARAEFDVFLARLQAVMAERYPFGKWPFALAAFHPEAPADLDNAERLIPFLRRSPDPCIQAVRMTVLERVRSGTPQGTQFVDAESIADLMALKESLPLRDRIARANLETVRRVGVEAVAARMEDIRRDRELTYQALAARLGAAE
jgi:hypothetical protein